MGADTTKTTLIGILAESLDQAARQTSDAVAPPCALLWTDPDSQWLPLLPRLRELRPNLMTLGDYKPAIRQGPAIWIRAGLDGTVAENAAPTIYLPGVSIRRLRSDADCPRHLQPLVELQYRGNTWKQKSGRDWTIQAFLVSKDMGLAFDIGRDRKTQAALRNALPELAELSVDQLQGKQLDARFFHSQLCSDLPRQLLQWLNQPEKVRAECPPRKWIAYCALCKTDLELDPDRDGEVIAAERLGIRRGPWAQLWDQFADAPRIYPNVPSMLRTACPTEILPASPSSWPQINDREEADLRASIGQLMSAPRKECRERILALEKQHGERRDWVWTKLGQAPLARAIGYMARLAHDTSAPLGGDSPSAMAAVYMQGAWEADKSALAAIAAVSSPDDVKTVTLAVNLLYEPWLRSAAEHLQGLIEHEPLPQKQGRVEIRQGEIVLFADALRFDVAKLLIERGQSRGWTTELSTRWAGLPSVTATAKYAVSPVADDITGDSITAEFQPKSAENGEILNADRFRKLLGQHGIEYVPRDECGDPQGRGWTEYGNLDKMGHSMDAHDFAVQISREISSLINRIEQLLDAGWHTVRVVTDHGWLWLPGGLPKTDLPKFLTESRWSRCATLKGNPTLDVPIVPWHWNSTEHVAVAPGISCFRAGHEYSHGGVSLQECLVPVISITRDTRSQTRSVQIIRVYWRRLRCDIRLDAVYPGLTAQLRTSVGDPSTAISAEKPISDSGKVSLLVPNEDLEGRSAIAVILNERNQVVAKKPSIIGGDA